MNYTGRPSISGCRPVLSLYPTHCFCQYLLRIFITFTNSSLFTRAFSTNSRRPLSQRLPLWGRSSTSPSALTRCHCPGSTSPSLLRNATARVAAPSVCFAAARILLAAAPTAPPCFRHWRRSSPLLPKGEALAGRKAQKIPHGGRNSLGDFSLPEMKALGSHISAFIVCHSPQKSSTAQKVYSHSSLWHSLYLFGEKSGIMGLRPCPPILWEGR